MSGFFRKQNVVPFFRLAAVYDHDGTLYLNPSARTRDGVSTGMAIVEKAEIGAPNKIGEKLLHILDQCVDNIPDDYTRGPSSAVAALVRAARVKSWRSFHQTSRELSIFQQSKGDLIQIIPLRKVESGAEHLNGKRREVAPLPEILGQAILFALTECE